MHFSIYTHTHHTTQFASKACYQLDFSVAYWKNEAQSNFYVAAGVKDCNGGEDCLGTEGVLRVSLGCSLFYFVMFLSTAGTSKLSDRREKWHSGWWLAKIAMLLALILLPFLLPVEIISIYGEVAHFGAGVFLLIQLVSIISFITWLNDCCYSEENADKCHIQVMICSTAAYIVCILGIILMYIWYTPEPSCLLNIFFISWTLVLLQVMTSVSLHPKVNAGFLTPGIMGLYLVFLCWSAIRSEPPEEKCIRKAKAATSKGDVLTIIVILDLKSLSTLHLLCFFSSLPHLELDLLMAELCCGSPRDRGCNFFNRN
nr:probable serine incorporator isoform X1 [Ipomoea batatas]